MPHALRCFTLLALLATAFVQSHTGGISGRFDRRTYLDFQSPRPLQPVTKQQAHFARPLPDGRGSVTACRAATVRERLEWLFRDRPLQAASLGRQVLGGVAFAGANGNPRAQGDWSGLLYRVRLVPYFAWSNLGLSHMTVWMPLVD